MVWKRFQIKKDNSFSGDDGTDVFSIGRGHAIGDMALRVRAKNAADHNVTGTGALAETVVEAISQIKLYSGSRTWKDYDAEICRAFATYKKESDVGVHDRTGRHVSRRMAGSDTSDLVQQAVRRSEMYAPRPASGQSGNEY